jgi:LysM repeat protein
MQITHEEAHKLIQYDADAELNPQQKEILSAHLKNCVDCQVYAKDIKEVESILVPVLKRHLNLQALPLSAQQIASKRNSKIQANIWLATRTAMIGFVFMAVALTFWQFILPSRSAFSQLPTNVLPVPTPSTQSTQSTSTSIQFQNCEMIIYGVQENDTLESITDQFSIAKEVIMAINHLKIETVDHKMELLIPICDSTPTGTVHPTTLTKTHTPAIRQNTSTPGG